MSERRNGRQDCLKTINNPFLSQEFESQFRHRFRLEYTLGLTAIDPIPYSINAYWFCLLHFPLQKTFGQCFFLATCFCYTAD